MDFEEKKIIEETLALAKENNTLLKKIRRQLLTSRIIRIVYWTVAIGFALGIFYFIQPYVETLLNLIGGEGLVHNVSQLLTI